MTVLSKLGALSIFYVSLLATHAIDNQSNNRRLLQTTKPLTTWTPVVEVRPPSATVPPVVEVPPPAIDPSPPTKPITTTTPAPITITPAPIATWAPIVDVQTPPSPPPTEPAPPTPPPVDACAVEAILSGPCPCMHHVCFAERDPSANCECRCPESKLMMAARNDPNVCGSDLPGLEWSGSANCACDLFHIPAPRVPTAQPTPTAFPTKMPTTPAPTLPLPTPNPTVPVRITPAPVMPMTPNPTMGIIFFPTPMPTNAPPTVPRIVESTPKPSEPIVIIPTPNPTMHTIAVPAPVPVMTPNPTVGIIFFPTPMPTNAAPTPRPTVPIIVTPTPTMPLPVPVPPVPVPVPVPVPAPVVTPNPTVPAPVPVRTPSPTVFVAPPTFPTMPQPPAGMVFGAFGQFCTAPNMASMDCTTTTAVKRDELGVVNCERPDDCCLCASIECGLKGDECKYLQFGDSAAFGVRDIQILGSGPNTILDCWGRTSCAYAMINAAEIGSLHCIGQYSCQNARITIRDPAQKFKVVCGVTAACQGMELELVFTKSPSEVCDPSNMQKIYMGAIECVGVTSCVGMQLTVNNLGCDRIIFESLECREGSCGEARFNFLGTVDIENCALAAVGAQPTGLEKCFMNLRALLCPEPTSCVNERKVITDPANDFKIWCSAQRACSGVGYTIDVTAAEREKDVQNMHIACTDVASCIGSAWAVYNAQRDRSVDPIVPLEMKVKIECIGMGSCSDSTFTIGRNIELDFVCGEYDFCKNCFVNGVPCHPDAPIPLPPR